MVTGLFGQSTWDAALEGGRGALEAAARIYGVVPAIVKKVHDPKNQRHLQGYVQVWFPWLQSEQDEKLFAPWARCVAPDAADKSGFKCTPLVGDEVLVAFEFGDPLRPYVVGSLWNGAHKVPDPTTPGDGQDMPGHDGGDPMKTPDLSQQSPASGSGKNKVMYLKSRKGNLLLLDDQNGTVRICDSKGNSRVSLEADTIKILQSTGDIEFWAQNTIQIDCETFEAHATSSIKYDAGNNISICAKGQVSTATGSTTKYKAGQSFMTISKKMVFVQAESSLSCRAGGKLIMCSESNKTAIEAAANLTATAVAGIEIKSSSQGNGGAGGMLNIASPAQVNFQASNDFKAAGAVILLN
ncbi:MAG: hypothetical protein KatS3mg102_0465 [Planctomycetota bacterium]|nr:MAG: hypothetical protein KatS3mg102_0465 [Planctomycetota bacterium]